MVGKEIAAKGAASAAAVSRRAIQAIKTDLAGLKARETGAASPKAGLYTYDLEPEYGQRRIHLRVDVDGHGVLFVDVTDVIHLNPTATTMAKLALEGVPITSARRRLFARIPASDRSRLSQDLREIYQMVDSFSLQEDGCPTCAIGAAVSSLENAPLFSMPARAPYKVDLALTYGCNNACGHCYNEPDRFTMPSLTRVQWLSVLDKLHEIGVPHVIFTGGEATLHPDLPALIQYADSLGMITGLNTNGRRIASESYMATLATAGLNHIQVTLGSSRPAVHDAIMGARSFEQTVRGIKNAIAAGVHCITNTTIMRCNMDHTTEIIHFLHDLGIRTFAMNGMIYSGGGLHDPNAIPDSEMPPVLIRIRDQAQALGMRFLWYTPTEYCRMSPVELEIGAKRCNAAEYSICIEPSGDVLPCQSFYVAAGNILHDPWDSIWRGDLFLSFRDRGADPRAAGLPQKCWDCPDLPLCGGGCRLERDARASIQANDPLAANGACSGSCSSGRRPQPASAGGFVASPGATSAARRATGGLVHVLDVIDAPKQDPYEVP